LTRPFEFPLPIRFIVGATVFTAGFLTPLLTPLVVASGLPAGWKTFLTGALAFGIPEVMALAAVAIMGKEGFQEFKRILWRLVKRAAPPARVSRTRYRIGLAMFALPVLFACTGLYLLQIWPQSGFQRLPWLLLGDAVFIASLFVLGGGFWQKIRALFVWEPASD
jgi:hypothetical protein